MTTSESNFFIFFILGGKFLLYSKTLVNLETTVPAKSPITIPGNAAVKKINIFLILSIDWFKSVVSFGIKKYRSKINIIDPISEYILAGLIP